MHPILQRIGLHGTEIVAAFPDKSEAAFPFVQICAISALSWQHTHNHTQEYKHGDALCVLGWSSYWNWLQTRIVKLDQTLDWLTLRQ